MGNILSYREKLFEAMNIIAQNERVIFLGQNVIYPGSLGIHESLRDVPLSQRIEVPVFEDTQMGLSIGLSLAGYIPVSIFPRMDFLIIAANQLVNHLDKIKEMSEGEFNPKVIVRTCIGSNVPLDAGPQHTQNHTEALRCLLKNVEVVMLNNKEDIVPAYRGALLSEGSTVLIEFGGERR